MQGGDWWLGETLFPGEGNQDSERGRNLATGHTERGGRNELRARVCPSPTSALFPLRGVVVAERGADPSSFADRHRLQAQKTDEGRDGKMRKTLG